MLVFVGGLFLLPGSSEYSPSLCLEWWISSHQHLGKERARGPSLNPPVSRMVPSPLATPSPCIPEISYTFWRNTPDQCQSNRRAWGRGLALPATHLLPTPPLNGTWCINFRALGNCSRDEKNSDSSPYRLGAQLEYIKFIITQRSPASQPMTLLILLSSTCHGLIALEL